MTRSRVYNSGALAECICSGKNACRPCMYCDCEACAKMTVGGAGEGLKSLASWTGCRSEVSRTQC